MEALKLCPWRNYSSRVGLACLPALLLAMNKPTPDQDRDSHRPHALRIRVDSRIWTAWALQITLVMSSCAANAHGTSPAPSASRSPILVDWIEASWSARRARITYSALRGDAPIIGSWLTACDGEPSRERRYQLMNPGTGSTVQRGHWRMIWVALVSGAAHGCRRSSSLATGRW